MGKTHIEWTGAAWNPIRARNVHTGAVGTHCVKVSPGCLNCYAETHNRRMLPHGSSGLPYTAAGAPLAEYFVDPEMLAEPLRRKKPETYFPCSMTDWLMFEPRFSAALLGVVAAAAQHTFQFLTKRPERFARLLSWLATDGRRYLEMGEAQPAASLAWWMADALGPSFPWSAADHGRSLRASWPLPNAWLGVSVEDRRHGLPRIDILRAIPAALRFLSIEPLLEDLGEINLEGIGWVIVGGESGHRARPFDVCWARSIIEQSRAAGVPVFVKQLGVAAHDGCFDSVELLDGGRGRPRPADQPLTTEIAARIRADARLPAVRRWLRTSDRKGGKPEEWPVDLRVREMPAAVPRG